MVAPIPRRRDVWRTGVLAIIALSAAAAALYVSFLIGGSGWPLPGLSSVVYPRAPQQEAQEEQAADEAEIPAEQVEKYINVYRAMQRDHSLNIEQAANSQGLTMEAFRGIESKIERDDLVREHVRQALANPSAENSTPNPKTTR